MIKRAMGILLIIFIVIFIYLIFIWVNKESYRREISDYCYKINELIKENDFFKASVSEKAIILYDKEDEAISRIDFFDYDEKIKINYIRKEEQKMYFVMQGSVDDESGIIFINDSSNSLIDGIYSLKRLGGNSYYYTTYPS